MRYLQHSTVRLDMAAREVWCFTVWQANKRVPTLICTYFPIGKDALANCEPPYRV